MFSKLQFDQWWNIDSLIDAVDHGLGNITVDQVVQDFDWVFKIRELERKEKD